MFNVMSGSDQFDIICIHSFLNNSGFGNDTTVTLASVSRLSVLNYW